MDFTGLSKLACGFQLYVHSFLRFDLVMMPYLWFRTRVCL